MRTPRPFAPLAAFAAVAAVAIAALALPGCATAGTDPELNLPSFSHLRSKAVDSTDLTFDGFLLRIAKHFAKSDAADSDEDKAALELLNEIKSVRVRNFTFDTDGAYEQSDIDNVRHQLSAPGWTAMVQSHKREPKEDVDVYLCMDNGKITGLAVIASEPREFTIVNIVGNIDIDKFAKLEGQFGIPRVSMNETQN